MSAVDREGRLGTPMTTKQILLNFIGFSEISLEMVGSGKENPKSATVCIRVSTFLDWQNSLTFPVFFAIFQYFLNVLFF